jgi:hypothetical protein
VPFGRQGPGWEAAYAVLFLISTEFSCINAHALFPDAGIWRARCAAGLRLPMARGIALHAAMPNCRLFVISPGKTK